MHSCDTDDQLRSQSRECGEDQPDDEHTEAHVGDQTHNDTDYQSNGQVSNEATAHSLLHGSHGAGELAHCAVSSAAFLLGQQQDALNQSNQTCADHEAVGQVVQQSMLAVCEALAEDVGSQVEAVAEDCEAKAVGLDDADDDGADSQSSHSAEVSKPGNTQQVHGQTSDLTHNTHSHTGQEQHSFLALVNNCLNGLSRSNAGSPGTLSGEHGGVEGLPKNGSIDDGCQEDTDQHGVHQLRSTHKYGDADGQDQSVSCGEGSSGDCSLNQVLLVNTSELLQEADGNTRQDDGEQSANDRGVSGNTSADNQLHTNDRTDSTQNHVQKQNSGIQSLGMLTGGNLKLILIVH